MSFLGRIAAKVLPRPDGRQRAEVKRLRSLPRYTPTTTDLLSPYPERLEVVDAASFLAAWREIFLHERYRFDAGEETAPRILDGGANLGLASLYFQRLYPDSRITAFEPDPVLAEACAANLERAGAEVELRRTALGAEDGKRRFVTEGADAGHLEAGEIPGTEAADRQAETLTVPCERLAPWLDQPVDLLKLDIEGAELEVLRACAGRLGQVRRVFVELHSFEGRPQGFGEILSLLEEDGFRLHTRPGLAAERPFLERPRYQGMDHQINVFAFRPEAV